MPRKGKLIVFLGPVGVGKSTIIRGLTQTLRARGFKVSTVLIKSFHGPSYILWVFIAKMLGIKSGYAPWFVIPRSGRTNLAKVLGAISRYLDIFLLIPLKLMKIKLLKSIGYYVISEEYLYSTLLDYAYPISDLKRGSKFVDIPIRVLNALISKYVPDSTIVLIASMPELRRRWALRGYGDPQLRYVAMQYMFLSRLSHALIIDTTSMSIKETLDKILSEVVQDAS